MIKKKKKLSDKAKLRSYFNDAAQALRTASSACPHFGDCGGCEFQDIPYPRQLELKKAAFAFIAGCVDEGFGESDNADKALALQRLLIGNPPEIVASPKELGYRQRMDYVYAFGKCGLRRVNRHRQVVELETCPLLGDEVFTVVSRARALADEAGLESYDYMRHSGELRYFVVRRSRNGEVLLSLVTKTDTVRDEVLGVLGRLHKEGIIASGHWLIAPGLGDVSFGERLDGVGAEWIVEELDGISLRIGPNTFFQSNPAVAEKAYAAIRDFAPDGGLVLDMYSGVGSIAAAIAGGAGRVVAVENVPDNVNLATINIAENRIGNVELLVDDSSRYLRQLVEDGGDRPGMVVVNPPRPGVGAEGMAAIAALGPEKLAYLSCNPFTLLRDLAEIAGGYTIRSLTIYDMFPQTRHFETLALLEKKSGFL